MSTYLSIYINILHQDHSNNLKSSIMVEEAILKLNSPSNTIESSSTSALEARLSRIEAIQGMKARLLTVNVIYFTM